MSRRRGWVARLFALSLTLGCVATQTMVHADPRIDDARQRLERDTSLEWAEQGQWLVATGAEQLWLFTKPEHPAHPAMASRRPVEKDGALSIETKLTCAQETSLCEAVLDEFNVIDAELKRAMTAQPARRTIEHPAFLLHVETGRGWEITNSEFGVVSVRRSSAGGASSSVGSVQLYRLPAFESDEAFLAHVTERREERFADDPRTEVISMRETIEPLAGATCIRLDYQYLDLGSRLDDGSVVSLPYRSLGYRCRHTHDDSLGLHLSFSVRTQEIDETAFASEAERFYEGFEFRVFKLD